LVGVNDYKDPYIQDLGGCVNDVLNIRAILKEFFGFEDAGIHVLTDHRATSENIKDRLLNLIYKSQDGDVSVFHFSGHGSQIRDRNRDELVDQLDELICPHDMNWNRPETFITDDDLSEIFEEGGADLCTSQVFEIFLDCCHSGTGLRQMKQPRQTLLDRNLGLAVPVWGVTLNRYTPPPIDILCRSMDVPELPIERLFLSNQALSDPILWSGCKSEQTAADAFIEGNYNGAFTWNLCNIIRTAPGGKGFISRGTLFQAVRQSLVDKGFDQVPQLETKHEGKLMSGLFE